MTASLFIVVSLFATGTSAAGQVLAPTEDINFPSGTNAEDALKWVGANGPWYAGPNVNGISSDVPENCHVDQAAYVSRHGSRYPDSGAYDEWTNLYSRLGASNYTASGALSFLPSWKPVLTKPSLQIAMENPTGVKEAYDMGYTLRTRYPDLYHDGDEFMVWANNYTRVLQTAQMFVRGFLGWTAPKNGSVISVTSKGFPAGIGDSLAPSDMCPNFSDTSGGDNKTTWDDLWIPPVQERLQALINGNLTLTANDVSLVPYLCGFESHITGKLSPWCDVFTDEEFKQYEYSNDLRYYYGLGPGTELPPKMMTPFLNSLIGLLARGPTINGTREDGSSFELPKLLAAFLNDGQLAELVTVSGVFDEQAPLSSMEKDDERLWIASRFVSMRGTIAFERLNCAFGGSSNSSSPTPSIRYHNATTTSTQGTTPIPTYAAHYNATYIRVRLNDAVYPIPSCKNGPGSSCLLSDYVQYVQDKYKAQGDWITNCNVTTEGAPMTVKGASFFTDLSSPWLQRVAP